MKLLFENFEKIIDSPNGFEQARQLVIGLAISGKLVEQLSTDEPAQELIKKISETKKSLIDEGKIKRQKDLDEVDEIPFNLPESWVWIRIGNLGSIFNGNSISAQLKATKYSNVKEGCDFIATKDVQFNSPELNYDNGIKIPTEEKKFKIAKKNSVLICSEGGSAGRKVGITEKDVCFGNKLFTIDTFIDLPAKYFYYVFNSLFFFVQFKAAMTGIIGGISLANFNSLLFPLPPLNEQKRILEKVDSLMSFLDELEEKRNRREEKRIQLNTSSLDKLVKSEDDKEFKLNWNRITDNFDKLYSVTENVDKLKQTILQLAVQGKLTEQWRKENQKVEPASELLKKIKAEKERLIKEGKIKKQKELPPIREEEKPFELPDSWEWCYLNHLSTRIGDGDHNTPDRVEKGFYLLSARNVTNEGIKLDDVDYVNEKIFQKLRLKCNPDKGDILISCSGSVGRVAIVDEDNRYVMVRSAAFVKIPIRLVNSYYLHLALKSPLVQYQIENKSRSTAQSNLFLTHINNLIIPLPSLKEQEFISRVVKSLIELCYDLENQIELKQQKQEKLVEAVVNEIAR